MATKEQAEYPDELLKKNWTFIVDPERTSKSWMEILKRFDAEMIISPLHEDEVNIASVPLKPHYHVALFSLTKHQAHVISNIVGGIALSVS